MINDILKVLLGGSFSRELDERYIPYKVNTRLSGEILFAFPDLPVRLYLEIRSILGSNGILFEKILMRELGEQSSKTMNGGMSGISVFDKGGSGFICKII